MPISLKCLRQYWLSIAVWMLAMNIAHAAPTAVGEIRTVSGIVSLKTAEGKNRFIAEGSKLFVGDVLTTEKESTAVLYFLDTSQVALRPSTRFVVQAFEFQPETPNADHAQFKLLKGGMRAVTGLIGKRGNTDAYQLQSETATIGIRGTDFSARLCKANGDCDDSIKDRKDVATTNATTSDVAGRISLIEGETKIISEKGKMRFAIKGSAVFAGDTVEVADDATVVIAMADNTRLTLPSGAKFQVTQYRYNPDSPDTSFASFKLLKGAVRTVTGLIGKAKPENVSFSTPTATVGIRGTAFDLACTTVTNEDAVLVQCSGGTTVAVDMREGQVAVTTDKGTVNVGAGQQAVIANASAPPVIVTTPINLFKGFVTPPPLPEKTPSNFNQLSSVDTAKPMSGKPSPIPSQSNPASRAETGQSEKGADSSVLFVAVNDGAVLVSNGNQQVMVNRGEGALVQTQTRLPPQFLIAPPAIIQRDGSLSAPPFVAPQCN